MKRKELLQFIKIILVSHKREDYTLLCNYGFKKILWFNDIEEAAIYFVGNPKILGEYDVFFEQYIRGKCNSNLLNLLWENKESILRVELYHYRFFRPKETIELYKKGI